MAFVNIGSDIIWPAFGFSTSSGFAGTTTMDAAGDQVAVVFRAPKTGTLAKVGFRTGTVTTGGTLRVSFQDVGGDGNPDEVEDQFADVVVVDTDDNVAFLTGNITDDGTAGGVKRTVTKGDVIAIVIRLTTAGNLQVLSRQFNGQPEPSSATTYRRNDVAGGAWSLTSTTNGLTLEYSDGTYAPIHDLNPFLEALVSYSVTTATTPDEVGIKIVPPVDMEVTGIFALLATVNTGSTASFVLYDAADAILASATLDGDQRKASGALDRYAFLFASAVTLTAGLTYRVTVLPTVGTWTVIAGELMNAAARGAMPGGTNVQGTTRTDAGAWTDSSTAISFVGIVMSSMDDGAGGGGDGSGGGSQLNRGLN
jgi:hypothetical protein